MGSKNSTFKNALKYVTKYHAYDFSLARWINWPLSNDKNSGKSSVEYWGEPLECNHKFAPKGVTGRKFAKTKPLKGAIILKE